MCARQPFGLHQLDMLAALIGDLEYAVDPLNGATDLFYAPDMEAAVAEIVKAYNASAWTPRNIRVFRKDVLPPGFIVGMKQVNTGIGGPYPDTVFMVTPKRKVEDVEVAHPDDESFAVAGVTDAEVVD